MKEEKRYEMKKRKKKVKGRKRGKRRKRLSVNLFGKLLPNLESYPEATGWCTLV